MAEGSPIERHWKLIQHLQESRADIPQDSLVGELSREFGTSRRTIERDLAMLESLGLPIMRCKNDAGKQVVQIGADLGGFAANTLKWTEAVSLFKAKVFFEPLVGTRFYETLQTMVKQIERRWGKVSDYFSQLDDRIFFHWTSTTDLSKKAGIIRVLEDAARTRTTVDVSYRSLWQGKTYTTAYDPYGLIYYNGDLFLVGHSHRAGEVRVFKVVRVRSAKATERQFENPEDYKIEDHLQGSFGIMQVGGKPVEVAVKFKGPTAEFVTEQAWQCQLGKFEPVQGEPDNRIVTFKLAGLVEFKRWILGFGENAEVLKPDSLRAELREELLAAAGQYDSLEACVAADPGTTRDANP